MALECATRFLRHLTGLAAPIDEYDEFLTGALARLIYLTEFFSERL